MKSIILVMRAKQKNISSTRTCHGFVAESAAVYVDLYHWKFSSHGEAYATVHERMPGTWHVMPRADFAFFSSGVTLPRSSSLMRVPDAVGNGHNDSCRPSLPKKSSAAQCSPRAHTRAATNCLCALLSAMRLQPVQFTGRCAYSCMGKRHL